MKVVLSQPIVEKYWNKKFHEISSTGSRIVSCGRTEGHDEINSRFSKFCEISPPPKKRKIFTARYELNVQI